MVLFPLLHDVGNINSILSQGHTGVREGVVAEQGQEISVKDKRDVHRTDEHDQSVADDLGLTLILLGQSKELRRNHLFPTQNSMPDKHARREDVENAPVSVIENFHFQSVDVPDFNRFDTSVFGHKERHPSRAEIVIGGVSETELLQMNRHKGEKHKTAEDEIVTAVGDCLTSQEVPRAAERNDNMQ